MYDIIFHINKKFMNYSIFTKSKLNLKYQTTKIEIELK